MKALTFLIKGFYRIAKGIESIFASFTYKLPDTKTIEDDIKALEEDWKKISNDMQKVLGKLDE